MNKQEGKKRNRIGARNIVVERVPGIWKEGGCRCDFYLRSSALNIHNNNNIYGLYLYILFRLLLLAT